MSLISFRLSNYSLEIICSNLTLVIIILETKVWRNYKIKTFILDCSVSSKLFLPSPRSCRTYNRTSGTNTKAHRTGRKIFLGNV